MISILVSGYYPEPNPDDSLHYKKIVPPESLAEILGAMTWTSLSDVPVGESELSQDQAIKVLTVLGDTVKGDLTYCLGLCTL